MTICVLKSKSYIAIVTLILSPFMTSFLSSIQRISTSFQVCKCLTILLDTIDISVDFGSAKNTPRPNEQVPISTLNIISMDEFKQRPPKIMNCQVSSL